MEGNNIRFTVLGMQNRIMGDFLCNITLEGAWLKYKILEIDENLESLVFPPPVECDELVLPDIGIGQLLKGREKRGIYSRYVKTFVSHHNMRFVGGQKGNNAWICIVDEEIFKSTFFVDEWHEKIGLAEMTDHQVLSEDCKLEKTSFSTGDSIIVNYSDEDRTVDSILVKAKGFKILS